MQLILILCMMIYIIHCKHLIKAFILCQTYLLCFCIFIFPIWKLLITGTLPVNKNYVTGTLPANKNYVTGTVGGGGRREGREQEGVGESGSFP